jgi:excinuclease UvrABC helicase subunit UvrB
MPWHSEPKVVFDDPYFEPTKAQSEGVERMLKNPHCHVEHATGTGKSFLVELLIKSTGLPTVVSTPSKSIARQMYDECILLFGKRNVGLFGDGKR